MRRRWIGAIAWAALTLAAADAAAQAVRVDVGLSARTELAPLTLAKVSGIFERHRLDVVLHKFAQSDLPVALAGGGIQCAGASVESWLVAGAGGLALTQIFQIDRGAGAAALVVRPGIAKFADLKGNRIATGPPGTASWFTLAWLMAKNGLSIRDVRTVALEPQLAVAAFAAGASDIDGVLAVEPFASPLRDVSPRYGVLATTQDQPMLASTFGCASRFLAANPGAGRALADSFFEALEMIRREAQKSFQIMAADVGQSADQFEASQKNVHWQDRAANRRYFAREQAAFSKEAADLLLDAGVIRQAPDVAKLADARYVQ